MKLELSGLRKITMSQMVAPEPKPGYELMKVVYCAVCKTDAKMWNEGHRDLIFPRVPGHEVCVTDIKGNLFAVWPGQSCGNCRYCQGGDENLCEEMKIMGFHLDGGFASHLQVLPCNLIPVPQEIPASLVCFAEPVGCVLNLMGKVDPEPSERVIIYGAGTMGLITALVCKKLGAEVLLIENDARKIKKAEPILSLLSIPCEKDTVFSEFDIAIQACSDTAAFALCLAKLAKGGRLGFFSGMTKNKQLESNLLNLIHYRELRVCGAYGLTSRHMQHALPIIQENKQLFHLLIEKTIQPWELTHILPHVLEGCSYRFLLDFSKPVPCDQQIGNRESHTNMIETEAITMDIKHTLLEKVSSSINPVKKELLAAAQHKIDNKTKPLGSLGILESLAVQASLIQQDLNPEIRRKLMLIFGSDHGVAEEGISAYPSEVTGQMLLNFLGGGAGMNVFCRANGIDFKVIDMGVKGTFDDHPSLIKKKIAQGTRNFAIENAMSRDEAIQSVEAGIEVFLAEHQNQPVDILGLGEVGIGNTTSAAAIISAVTGIEVKDATGRGSGLDDKGLEHKTEVIQRALKFHQPNPKDGLDILSKIGGFELGGIAGAVLAAASQGVIVVLDGVISTAAGLIAYLINPKIQDFLVSGHKSVEIGQKAALHYLGLQPVLDLNMRLGEGTGAAITINLVEIACKVMTEMASFDDAGVSKSL